MMIRHKLTTLVILLIVSVTACYINNGSVQVRYVGNEKEGYYEVTMNYNNDSDYHMGQLYGKILISQYPTLETNFANYISGLPPEEYNKMMTRVQQVKNQVPQEYRDFIDGLAGKFNGGTSNNKDDVMLSSDEVFYFSLISEVNRSTQCSAIAVYNSTSNTGKPIIGRYCLRRPCSLSASE